MKSMPTGLSNDVGRQGEGEARFNLKAVVQQTGLKADTLRAWERRYSLPRPERSPGGHRIYSQADINCLLWLVARQAEGLNISQAVQLWEQTFGDETVAVALDPTTALNVTAPSLPEFDLPASSTLLTSRHDWVEACLEFDRKRAEQIAQEALSLYPVELVCREIYQLGLRAIGQAWYEGDATAQQEHFASAVALRSLESLLVMTPSPTRKERVMLACPPGEKHTFNLLLLTLLLRRRSLPTIYLGEDVPIEGIMSSVETIQPSLLVLASQQLPTAATLLDVVEHVQLQVPIAYGGLIFHSVPALHERIPGTYLGDSIEEAVFTVEKLLVSGRTTNVASPDRYASVLAEYRARRPQIEAYVWTRMGNSGIPLSHRIAAKDNFGQQIDAALRLGDLDFLGRDLTWVAGLLSHRRIPHIALTYFIQVYIEGARRHLGPAGEPLISWLKLLLGDEANERVPLSRPAEAANPTHRRQGMELSDARDSSSTLER